MLFSKTLLAKGLGGLALLGTSCASAYGGHKIIKNEPTKFDQGLIDYLENEGRIKFAVKDTTSNSDGTDLGTSFPTFSSSGQTQSAQVSIKVLINTGDGDESTDGKLTDSSNTSKTKGLKATLKKLNGGNDWTWTCIIKFIRKPEDSGTSDMEENQKNKLIQNSTEGLFNKLKEDNNKEEKVKFIKNCAEARGGFENLKIGLSSSLYDNKIESIKEFKLKADNSKLKIEEAEFNKWFDNSSSSS